MVDVRTEPTDDGRWRVVARCDGRLLFDGALGPDLAPDQFAALLRQALPLILRPITRPTFPSEAA